MRPGCDAHTRGWHAGVRVTVTTTDDGRDAFAVAMTGGSSGHHSGRFLGTVADTPDGPAWIPSAPIQIRDLAGMLATTLAGADYGELDAKTLDSLEGLRVIISGALAGQAELAAGLDPAVFGPVR
jgi:hypothetical protein